MERTAHAGGLSLVGHTSSDFTSPARVEAYGCTIDGCEQVLVSSLRYGESPYEHLWDALVAEWAVTTPAAPGERWTARCSEHREGR